MYWNPVKLLLNYLYIYIYIYIYWIVVFPGTSPTTTGTTAGESTTATGTTGGCDDGDKQNLAGLAGITFTVDSAAGPAVITQEISNRANLEGKCHT